MSGVRELLGGPRSPRGRAGRRAEAGRVPGRRAHLGTRDLEPDPGRGLGSPQESGSGAAAQRSHRPGSADGRLRTRAPVTPGARLRDRPRHGVLSARRPGALDSGARTPDPESPTPSGKGAQEAQIPPSSGPGSLAGRRPSGKDPVLPLARDAPSSPPSARLGLFLRGSGVNTAPASPWDYPDYFGPRIKPGTGWGRDCPAALTPSVPGELAALGRQPVRLPGVPKSGAGLLSAEVRAPIWGEQGARGLQVTPGLGSWVL